MVNQNKINKITPLPGSDRGIYVPYKYVNPFSWDCTEGAGSGWGGILKNSRGSISDALKSARNEIAWGGIGGTKAAKAILKDALDNQNMLFKGNGEPRELRMLAKEVLAARKGLEMGARSVDARELRLVLADVSDLLNKLTARAEANNGGYVTPI